MLGKLEVADNNFLVSLDGGLGKKGWVPGVEDARMFRGGRFVVWLR